MILLDSVTLNPGAQLTLNLPNTYPDLANVGGKVTIDADINRLAITGLRRDPISGAVTPVPGMPRTASSTSAS